MDIIEQALSKISGWNERAYLCSYAIRAAPGDITSRKNFPSHATASAIVHDTISNRVLLVHHGFLGKWLFPGGHMDPDESLVRTAARETLEETGLDVSARPYILVDVDMHDIPANPSKDEPEHRHCDFRFMFSGEFDRSAVRISAESNGFVWVPVDELESFWPGRKAIADEIRRLAAS